MDERRSARARGGADSSWNSACIKDLEPAVKALQGSAYSALRGISCRWQEGNLVLEGRVPSYYLKQLAQAAVQPMRGGAPLINRIEVTA